jgi:hypothetical protein
LSLHLNEPDPPANLKASNSPLLVAVGPERVHEWSHGGEEELGKSAQGWNWVLLGGVLGCLLFWALVIWGSLNVL